MTYGGFLALFLGLPLVILAIFSRRILHRTTLIALSVLAAVAVVYTGPWDNVLITSGVWSYGRGTVIGLDLGRVPLEEYAFYVLQVGLTGIFAFRLVGGWKAR